MRKSIKLLFLCSIILLASSCVTLNTHTYSINNLDGKGQVDNNSFSVSYGDDFIVLYDASGTFTIRNNKDSVLYIDMANSYFLDNEGQAERLFTNTVQTTYSSSTTGASVNLGSIARVLGAGPITSTLASGVTIGSSTTGGVAVQQIEDQYIGIPPYSSVKIKFQTLGTDIPFNKKKGIYTYNKPSESQILSYTYMSENPKWTMIRNQFILDRITVEDASMKEGVGDSNPKEPSVRIGVTNNKRNVKYNTDRVGRIVAISLGGIGGAIGVALLIKALLH